MKSSRRMLLHFNPLLIAAALLSLNASSTQAITIDLVTVGNPFNTADTLVMSDATTGYGQVNYTYSIGKYEVTNAQYAAFLNAVAATDTHSLYNTQMDSDANGGITRSGSSGSYTYAVKSGYNNKPVVFVNFWDAARFTNWMHNGQPAGAQGLGTTEDGAYDLGGVTNPTNATIFREPNAQYYVSTENEWYKAAYYDPTLNSGAGGYTLYATRSNTAPTSEPPAGGANSANFMDPTTGYAVTGSDTFDSGQNYLTDVGAYQLTSSYYGTFDQTGNAFEWNEEIVNSSNRGLRGGSFTDVPSGLVASFRPDSGAFPAGFEGFNLGFRISSSLLNAVAPPIVPEPASGAMLLMGMLLLRRRRNQ